MNRVSAVAATPAARAALLPHTRLLVYACVLVGLLLLLSMVIGRRQLVDQNWFLFVDVFAMVLSFVIGVIGLAYYRSFRARSLMFISSGFLGSGIIDAVHVLSMLGQDPLVFEFFGASENWSAVAARLHLAIMLLAGWTASQGRISPVAPDALRDRTVVLLSFGLWGLLFTLAFVLPHVALLNGGLTALQLAALLTGALFCGTLGIFLSRGDWKRYAFQHWFVIALLILTVSELLFIPLARWESGGVMFTSEVLRLLAYLLIFVALMSNTSSFFAQASTMQLEQRVSEMIDRRWLDADRAAGVGEIRDGLQRINHAGTFELDLVSGRFRGNRAALDLFGGGPQVRTLQQFVDLLHPEDRWRLADALMRSESQGDLFKQEYRVLLAGGYRWLEATAGIETVDGRAVRLLGYLEDITGRKQVELEKDALYRDLEQLVTAVDTNALTVSLDLEGRITDANERFVAFCGLEEGALGGRLLHDVVDLDPARPAVAALDQGCGWSGQISVRRPDGEVRTAAGSLTGHVDEGGSADSCIFLGFDISDRIRAEEALKESVKAHRSSNQDLQMFAHIVSHDLQEPLRMVSSFLKLLERRYTDALNEEGREFIHYAVEGATRMRSLLDGLLEYSRVQSKGLEFEPVDLAEPVRDALANLAVLIEESGASVEVDALPVIDCDRSQVMQLIQNLVSNAIKFCRDRKPEIRITSRQVAGRWVVDVEDNGIGIDADHHERIFQIFQRLHGRDEYPGTGVGLAICARIMERHGGGIEVESEPGRGSRFSLRF